MKKILIISHALELGGVERSLIGLLNSIDYSMYDVDLFLLRHEGELMDFIPKEVHLLDEIKEYTVLGRPMVTVLKEGHLLLTLGRLYGKIRAKIHDRLYADKESYVGIDYSHKYTYRLMPKINPNIQYDLAISFLTPHYITQYNVNAKKKVGWIHTDYSTIYIDKKSETKIWSKLDNIISISDSVTGTFLNTFPSLKNKILLIENILPQIMVLKQSVENIDENTFSNDCINLLSIGRLTYQKNFENIPKICNNILNKGINVKWYIIGFGPDQELIEEKIKEYGMEDHVIILGKKDNPYPYIKACDFYVQPSRYEGKCVAVREAQMLNKPVIITRYDTSASQLTDGYDGVIVGMDNEGCANGIVEFIKNKDLQETIINNLKENDYSNSSEINKIYSLIDD